MRYQPINAEVFELECGYRARFDLTMENSGRALDDPWFLLHIYDCLRERFAEATVTTGEPS